MSGAPDRSMSDVGVAASSAEVTFASARSVSASSDDNTEPLMASAAAGEASPTVATWSIWDSRRALRTAVCAGHVLAALALLAGVALVYARLSGAQAVSESTCSWAAVLSPFIVAAVIGAAKSALWLAWVLWSAHTGVYPWWALHSQFESFSRSLALALAVATSLALASVQLEHRSAGLTASLVVLPVLLALAGFVVADVARLRERQRDRLVEGRWCVSVKLLVANALALLTTLLAALRLDGFISLVWLAVLALPAVLLCAMAVACVGFTAAAIAWTVAAWCGRTDAFDAALARAAFPIDLESSDPDGWNAERIAALVLMDIAVVLLDVVCVCFVLPFFELIRVLSDSNDETGTDSDPINLMMIFVPLLVNANIALLSVVCVNLAHVYIGLEQFRRTRGDGGVRRKRRFNSCMTCRQPVKHIVKLDGANVHVDVDANVGTGEAESAESADSECTICRSAKADSAFLPCGHGGVCNECANKWAFQGREGTRLAQVETPLYLIQRSKTYFQQVFRTASAPTTASAQPS